MAMLSRGVSPAVEGGLALCLLRGAWSSSERARAVGVAPGVRRGWQEQVEDRSSASLPSARLGRPVVQIECRVAVTGQMARCRIAVRPARTTSAAFRK